jgi:hypothetical protein
MLMKMILKMAQPNQHIFVPKLHSTKLIWYHAPPPSGTPHHPAQPNLPPPTKTQQLYEAITTSIVYLCK